MSKERRLGRGLAALLGGPLNEQPESNRASGAPAPSPLPFAPRAASAPSQAGVDLDAVLVDALPSAPAEINALQVAIADIETNPFQPRRVFSESEIASLCESLKAHQMIQPVLVRRVGGRYQLISGERRLRAATQAGWTHVPAHVREADDRLVAEIAIVENLQRQDLNPLEKALSFSRYLQQHGCTQDELAGRIKINRSTIANLIRLLELPQPVQDAISSGQLSAGHARALLPLGDEREQVNFCSRIVRDGLSVRDVEAEVQSLIDEADSEPLADGADAATGKLSRRARPKNEQVAALETELRRVLGAKVEIRTTARGRGKLTIHFTSLEDFDRLKAHLTGGDEAERKVA